MTGRGGRRVDAWLAAALLLAAAVGALNLGGEFVYDDARAILENPLVQGGLPAREAFTRSFWGEALDRGITTYRPLAPLTWRLLWKVGGGAALLFRAWSLLLHAAATGLLWALLRRLGVGRHLAGMTALLFAVHPAQAEAVGATVAQADLLGALLGLGCLLVLASRRPSAPFVAALLLSLGCLAKESTFLFAAPAAWLVLADRRDGLAGRWLRLAPVAIVTLGVILLQLSLERNTVDWSNSLAYEARGLDRLLLGLHWIGRAAVMCLLPHGFAAGHGYAAVDLSWRTLAGHALVGLPVLLAFPLLLAAARHRRSAPAGVLLLLFYGPILLVSSLVVAVPTDLPERLLYPATMAAAYAFAWLVQRGFDGRRRAAVLALLLVALAAGRALAQAPWRAAGPLWEHAVSVEPESVRNQFNLAQERYRQGRLDEAAWHRLLAAYASNRHPRRVDWEPVRRMEREMTVIERLREAPGLLAPGDPCWLARGMVGVYRETLPEVSAGIGRAWRERYPQCFPDGR